jgi:hypothetical protein
MDGRSFPSWGIGKRPDPRRKAQDASGRVKAWISANPEKQAPGYGTKGAQASKRIRWDHTVAALIMIAIPNLARRARAEA